MTPKERAAMQQALEFLESGDFVYPTELKIALQEALEQHNPHEECECNTCLNYFTDKAHEEAFQSYVDQAKADRELSVLAAVLAEREVCAKVCEEGTGEAVQKTTLEILLNERKRIAKAIRNRGDE